MRVKLLLSLCLVSMAVLASGQSTEYFSGYAEEISGTSFAYHSPFPDVTSSLLMRGRSDFPPIRWRTEVVPESYQADKISFVWLYSMDTDPEPVPFTLKVNGKEWFSFSNPLKGEIGTRKIHGPDGAELSFRVTMIDLNGDEMGFAILTLPSSAVEPGKAVELEIGADDVGDDSWFMTYRSGIREEMKLYQNRVVVKDEDALLHSLSIDIIHIGEEARCSIQIGDQHSETYLLTGYNPVEVFLPKVNKTTEFKALIRIEGRDPVEKTFSLSPVKEWEIFLVQHTHSDIGYTRPQTEILAEHLRYIDHALDYCDQTDDYPDASQFRWTCETS